jgi:cytochrome P450
MIQWTLRPLAGEGLFTSDDPLWRRQRKIMAPLFHRSQLDQYAVDMVDCTRHHVDGWRDGQVVEMAPSMVHVTMAIAGKTLFDADTLSEADELGEALNIALEWSGRAAGSMFAMAHMLARRQLERAAEGVTSPRLAGRLGELARRFHGPLFMPGAKGREARQAIAVLDDKVAQMIQDRRNQGLGHDLLSKLLAARDDDGAAMDDRQIRDEVLTLFIAGHETTATGLAWTFQLLCEHPELYARAQAEADSLSGSPTVADLGRLSFCLRAFKEALRLYPPVFAFGRCAREDVELGGVAIPRNTVCVMAPLALHHRADLWPEPERFDPERFLPAAEAARHRYAWLPFGAGPRICIGNHFAMMEAPLVLAEVLRRYRLEPMGHELPRPFATLRPQGPMPMRVIARRGTA